MKVFFTAAIAGMEEYGENYQAIVAKLEGLGHSVQADHILKADRDQIRNEVDDEQRATWYRKVLKMISESEVVVAEVSTPSTNIGLELSIALEKGVPIVALYKRGHHPVLWQGIKNDKLLLVEYTGEDDLLEELQSCLEYSKEQRDTRFNFFVSPKIASYLDWVSSTKRVPRAVYLRNLIKEEMKNEEDYS